MRTRTCIFAALAVAPAIVVACVDDAGVSNVTTTPDAGSEATTTTPPTSTSTPDATTAAPILDATFATNGVLTLDGVAIGLVAVPNGLAWLESKGTKTTIHRLTLDGQPDPAGPIDEPRDPSDVTETPQVIAVAQTASGTPVVLVGGAGGIADDQPVASWWARAYDPTANYVQLYANTPVTQDLPDERTSAIAFEPASSSIVTVVTGQNSFTPPRARVASKVTAVTFADNALGASVIADPAAGGSFIAAAIAQPDAGANANLVAMSRVSGIPTPNVDASWHDGTPLFFGPDGGTAGVGLFAADGGVLAGGLSSGGEVFFQRVDETGHTSGALTTLTTPVTTFSATAVVSGKVLIAGCSATEAWIGTFDVSGTPVLASQVVLDDTPGECVRSLAVDGKNRVIALLSQVGTNGGVVSNRIVRLAP